MESGGSMDMNVKSMIENGNTCLGIELGSTRIKAVLIGEDFAPIASGGHDWENRLQDGVWTYHLDDVWKGLQNCYAKLVENVRRQYGVTLSKIGAVGISAMMHGYLVFDSQDRQLVPFRTWRNTSTEQAASELTREFFFNIPQRWSIAHLYQAILNGEEHVRDVGFMTTLAGYVHWKLSGKKVLGVGDASGMFPIDSGINDFHFSMKQHFQELIAEKGYPWSLSEILPTVLSAGADAGALTAEGARLLDPTGMLQPGVPMCPPEGDAGTGMTATNSVAEKTGNVSAGTSIFAMVVLEEDLSQVYTEIDMVTTPDGRPVAMVHCNNCTSDLDAWIRLFAEFNSIMGNQISKPQLYDIFYYKALEGRADCGGLLSYNYFSGEPITGLEQGRPLFVRMPDGEFTFPNFARCLLLSTMATLKIGMDILTEQEHVRLQQLLGHGGLFKTKGVGQRLMAGALDVPVTVMESAGEGGAWGIALLAAYRIRTEKTEGLANFLQNRVFAGNTGSSIEPDAADHAGFQTYMERYQAGLATEKAAVENL